MQNQPSPETIFQEALNRTSPLERTAYLDKACGSNLGLRKDVDSLLAAHQAADTFMNTLADTVLQETPLEKEGNRIGRYKLLQQIGEGGFGTVYLAEQTEPVQRRVALKVIKAGMDSKEVIARFEAERQALALMDHPHIAKVFDAGTTEGGRPYFVMELVKGIPLTRYCEAKHLNTKARLQLFKDVCAAVQHAHQKGVIHRDLKPSNILVSPHDGKPVVKVIDFGIAKAIGIELTEKTVFTQHGRMIGTPQYMSPEQAELNALDVDTRSDIYSLGVVLYELLTGTTPLDGEQLRSAAYNEIQRLIREQTPPKPSTRISSLAKLESHHRSIKIGELNGDLDWIAMKALEKDRVRRYHTADELARDVDRHLNHQPVSAGPPSTSYLLSKFVRRNRRGLLTCLATSAALFIGLSVASGLWLKESRRVAKVEFSADKLLTEASQLIAEHAKSGSELDDKPFRRASELTRQAAKLIDGTEGIDESVQQRCSELLSFVETEDRGRALVSSIEEILMNELSIEDNDKDQKKTLIAKDFAQAFDQYGINPLDHPTVETAMVINRLQGLHKHVALGGLQSWARAIESTHPDQAAKLEAVIDQADDNEWRKQLRIAIKNQDASALETLANSPEIKDQPAEILISMASAMAEQQIADQLEKILRLTQAENPTSFWPNYMLGMVIVSKLHRKEGEDLREQTVYTGSLIFGNESVGEPQKTPDIRSELNEGIGFLRAAVTARPDSALTWTMLAAALSGNGQLEEAIVTSRKALSLEPNSSGVNMLMGSVLLANREFEEAVHYLRRSVELDEESWGTRYQLGMTLLQLGEYEEGEIELRQAVKSMAEDDNSGSEKYESLEIMGIPAEPDESFVTLMVAFQQLARGDFSETLAKCREHLVKYPDDIRAIAMRGFCLVFIGEYEAAEPSLKLALENGIRNQDTLNAYALSLMGHGRYEEALDYYHQALAFAIKHPDQIASTSNAQILCNMGGCLVRLNRPKEAEETLQKAVKSDPSNAMAWSNLGKCLNLQGHTKQASKCFEKVLELNPADSTTLQILIDLYWQSGEREKAIETANRFNDADAFLLLGRSLTAANMSAEAIDALQRSIALNPGRPLPYQGLAFAYFDQGREEEGLSALQTAIRVDPESVDTLFMLAEIYWKRDEYLKATHAIVEGLCLQDKTTTPEQTQRLLLLLGGSGHLSACLLAHGSCGGTSCPLEDLSGTHDYLVKSYQEGHQPTPEFQNHLKKITAEMTELFGITSVLKTQKEEDLEKIWNSHREEILLRLSSATIRLIQIPKVGEADGEKILQLINDGAEFNDVAELYSQGWANGKPQTVSYGQLIDKLNDAAFSLPVGDFTKTLIDESNLHYLLKVESRTQSTATSYEDAGVQQAAEEISVSLAIEKWQQRYLNTLEDPSPNLILAKVRYIVGKQALDDGDIVRAEELFTKSLEVLNPALGPEHSITRNVKESLKLCTKRSDEEKNYATEERLQPLDLTDLDHDQAKSVEDALKTVDQLKSIEAENNELVRALIILGNKLREVTQHQKSASVYREAVEMAEKLHPNGHQLLVYGLNRLGDSLQNQGENRDAAKAYEKALAVSEQLESKGTIIAETHNSLGLTYEALGEYDKGEAHLKKALKLYVERYGENHPGTAAAMNNLALNLNSRAKYKEAKQYYLKVLQVKRDPIILSNLGSTLINLAEIDEARNVLHEAIESFEQNSDPETIMPKALALSNLAMTYKEDNQNEKAIELLRKALQLHAKAADPTHPDQVKILTNLGTLLSGDEAVKLQQEALDAILKNLGPGSDHPLIVLCLGNLAKALESQGDLLKSQASAEKAIAMSRRLNPNGQPNSDLANLLIILADIQFQLHDFTTALENSRQGADMLRDLFPPNHPAVVRARKAHLYFLNRYGDELYKNGRYAEAIPLQREMSEHIELLASDDLELAKFYSSFGSTLHLAGQLEQAVIEHKKAIKFLGDDATIQPEIHVRIHLELALTLREINKLDEAATISMKGIEICRNHAAKDTELFANTLMVHCKILRANDNPAEAMRFAKEAVEILQDAPEANPTMLAKAMGLQGAILADQDLHDKAVKHFEDAVKITTDPRLRAFTLTDLSISLGKLDRKKEAKESLDKIEAWAQALRAPPEPYLLENLSELMESHYIEKNWSTLEALVRAKNRMEMAVRRQTNPLNQIILSIALLGQDKSTESLRILRATQPIIENLPENQQQPILTNLRYGLCQALAAEGYYAESEIMTKETMRFFESTQGRDNPTYQNMLLFIGRLEFLQERYVAAITTFKKVLENDTNIDPDIMVLSHCGIAQSLNAMGKHKEAYEEIEKAFTASEQMDEGIDHSRRRIKAMILRDQGNMSDADLIFLEILEEIDADPTSSKLDPTNTLYEYARSLEMQDKFAEALTFAEQTLKIQQEASRPKHPEFGKLYELLSNIHDGLANTEEAEKYRQLAKALK